MAEAEEKQDNGSQLGETAGRKAGGNIGGQVAGRGGAAAATSTGSAAGTAAGTVAGSAGAAGAGAAAGSVVPGAGTAVGAVAGSVIGKYWKKLALGAGGCFLMVMILVLLPVIIAIIVIMVLIGGGSNPPPNVKVGLRPNYCEQISSQPCSDVLRLEIIRAGVTFTTPPAVLAGVLSIEGHYLFAYDDATVTKNSAPGAKDTEGIGYSTVPQNVSQEIGCAVYPSSATGPMAFAFNDSATLLGVAQTGTTKWANYAADAQQAINDGRTVHPCNILDSLFAASDKLHKDGNPNVLTLNWRKENVYEAVSLYFNVPISKDSSGNLVGCSPSGASYLNYCEQVWQYYLTYSDNPIDDGANTTPNGWPASGSISTLFGDTTVAQYSHTGIDIAGDNGKAQDVWASVTGTVIRSTYEDNCGGRVVIETTTSPKYEVEFLHLDYQTIKAVNADLAAGNSLYVAGTGIGATHEGPLAPDCSTGTHLHYEIHKDGTLVDALDYTPFAGMGEAARNQAVTAGGVNWKTQ